MANTEFEFTWKYGDFEIRTTRALSEGHAPYVELVKWEEGHNGKRSCFTLAYYRWDDEGGELSFVGERPFEEISEIDISPVWKQLCLACQMLKDWCDKEYQED